MRQVSVTLKTIVVGLSYLACFITGRTPLGSSARGGYGQESRSTSWGGCWLGGGLGIDRGGLEPQDLYFTHIHARHFEILLSSKSRSVTALSMASSSPLLSSSSTALALQPGLQLPLPAERQVAASVRRVPHNVLPLRKPDASARLFPSSAWRQALKLSLSSQPGLLLQVERLSLRLYKPDFRMAILFALSLPWPALPPPSGRASSPKRVPPARASTTACLLLFLLEPLFGGLHGRR